ncbi:restriction endonuclease [Vibrio breoganii]|uniref:restriction endonuclease subunit S n=2 Tax=Vibrio breoganii TaxID=553239 RepID=UPI000C81AE61|nr:restriction endonuclease subunit S [Vibrio breoganii]PMM88707.1 restriction endonuclease [Vibrio breoganii]
MTCNWIEIPLGDFIELKRGYDLPKSKRLKGDKPIISSAGLSDYHSESKVTSPGVVTGRYGTIGEVFYIEEDFWPLNTTLYVKDFKGNCPEFVYYLLKTFDFHKYSDKAAVPGVNRNHLHMEKVCVPSDYVWQERIASYISKFDKKITLSAQTNQTLEEMAQAIFKSWFVDFDPVKAKMNGEQPEGMDAITASLFPEKLVESELGLIPEGWEASSMGEHFNVTMGQSPKGETYNEDGEGIAFFQGRRDFGFRYPDVRVFTTDPKRYAKAGDTLISVRAPVGDKNMAAIDCCIGRGVGAIKHKSDSRSFTYAFVSHIEKKLGDSGSSGTVFSSINQKELKKVSFVAPPQELVEAFHNLVDPIDQKVEVLSKEIDSLSQLRDTLLPKLLSGEIELDIAEVNLND